jgi:hypothetical protein
MFMAFSLLPSCLPIVPPDTVQVAGNLGCYWGPNGCLPWGTRPEHMLRYLGCDRLTTLELPILYNVALQY